MAEDTEFKFPDELPKEAPEGDAVEIEIVDDTPAQDRNRAPMPKEIVDELENDDLDKYSEGVKKRMSQMKKVWHDERREKERASRERDEAARIVQQMLEENRVLKLRVGKGEQVLVQEVTRAASTEVATAKEKLKQAYDSGDTNLITEAQEALMDAKVKLREYEKYKPALQPQQDNVERNQPVREPRPPVDERANNWREKNTWFGADEEMTALAIGLHEKMVKNGADPRSNEYYSTIDATMRKRFPEYFEEEQRDTRTEASDKERLVTRKPATVVAPATRSTAPRQIKLSASSVAIAKKLGISNEAYAREVLKLENSNG
jgi:hypothetical protein